ncbi:hypothetical protein PVAP13_9NG518628 [Panicum virgatum]|uniref:Uncharacterized protein n=1 Tax=Panicum virgatum TaxID=38727 RepID=A0A8T0MSG0_PANVG|nr:hypothetical protein PVAP13_9NG518628 [Panicum virgatum]
MTLCTYESPSPPQSNPTTNCQRRPPRRRTRSTPKTAPAPPQPPVRQLDTAAGGPLPNPANRANRGRRHRQPPLLAKPQPAATLPSPRLAAPPRCARFSSTAQPPAADPPPCRTSIVFPDFKLLSE